MMQATFKEADRLHRLPPLHALQTLELNASYEPLSTWPLSLIPATEAITKLYKERAVVVETWKDEHGFDRIFRSPSIEMPAPKVIVLKEYVNICGEPKPTRRNFLLRDRYSCQYCGKRFHSHELTFDHLIPRSRGGKTTWDNIVMACSDCNAKKADKMPDFSGRKGSRGSGLRPLKLPHRPSNAELLKAGMHFLSEMERQTWGEWLYWTIELEP